MLMCDLWQMIRPTAKVPMGDGLGVGAGPPNAALVVEHAVVVVDRMEGEDGASGSIVQRSKDRKM